MTLDDSNSQTPWLRREFTAVVRLATPVVMVQVGFMIMGVVDSMMLGRVSEAALASGALGNSLVIGLSVFPMGILMALDPLVSQAFGAGDQRRMGRWLQRGLVLALLLSIPLAFLMWNTEGFMRRIGQQPEIITDSAAYVRANILGVPAYLIFVSLRQTLQAMSLIRPALIAIVLANLVNVLANYTLIFGNFGFPALGVVGSGYATSLSRWVMVLVLGLTAWQVLQPFLVRRSAILQWRGFSQMLKIGFPIGWQVSLELWVFVAVALMMGNLGARQLAAHQIALSLASLTFMIPLGIGGAATTRVGNAIGRGNQLDAWRSARVCLGVGAGVMAVSASTFYLFPKFLSQLFTNEQGVITLAVALIPIAALFQVFDGLQVVSVGVLRATADTRLPAIFAFVSFWVLGLPLGWYLAFRRGLGPQGLWLGLTLGLAVVAVLLLVRIWVRFSKPIEAVAAEEDI